MSGRVSCCPFALVILLLVSLNTQAQPVEEPDLADLALLAPRAVEQFYADQQQHWRHESIAELVAALQGLEDHGLNPDHYHLAMLQDNSTAIQMLDYLASDAWFSAAAHMVYGKLDPVTVEPDWTAASRQVDLAAILRDSLANDSVRNSLDRLAPRQKEYTTLLQQYARIKAIAQNPEIQIPTGMVLKPGMNDGPVLILQNRLVQLGFLSNDQANGSMDDDTVAAVKLFQDSSALEVDGIAGPATLAALNRDTNSKLNQLRVNLERWRWLPDDLGTRHLRANIADFNVTAFVDGEPVRSHLIIVGRTYRKTPVFSDEIEYIIFNPWWEIPPSIARTDELRLFQRDPEAVERMGFRVLDRDGVLVDPNTIDRQSLSASRFPYRLRQAPGEQNALGQVKMMFPNSHNVYLHDTPSRGLFAQRQRAFSSGCLRTQFPLDLAAWLLEDTQGWTRDRIDTVVASGRETRVNLTTKVPVHILYFTTVSEADGHVRFIDDIYQRDGTVLAALIENPF